MSQIMAAIEALDSDDSQFHEKMKPLFDELKHRLNKEHKRLSVMMAMPFRVKVRLSDSELIKMADEIDVLKICIKGLLKISLGYNIDEYLEYLFQSLRFHADFYRYIGFEDCDLPFAFKIESDTVVKAIIQESLENGYTTEKVIEKFTEGFDEFADMVKRRVISKYHMTDNTKYGFTRFLHPDVVKVSFDKFRDGYYADAVFSAFKEVNNRLKEMVRNKAGQELDGANLITTAFSSQNPLIMVESNLDTQTNRDTQRGYMMLFSGAMSAIRNPKAHENFEIGREDAVRKLMFASMLMYKLDATHFVAEHE